MKAVKNILVPIDFSINAELALKYALNLYGDENVKFIMFHCYEPPVQSGTLISISDIIKQEAHRNLVSCFEKTCNELDLEVPSVFYVVENDDFYHEVKKVVDEYNVDLIVMGTKGASNAVEVALGSNTSKLIKRALAPIIVVPNKKKLDKPSKILLAEDYSHTINLEVLEPLKELAIKFNSLIEILYVRQKGVKVNQAIARVKFDNFFGDIPHKFHYIEQGDTLTSLVKFSEEEEVSMVVTLPGKNNIFDDMLHKSVTNKLVLKTEVPLFALHQFSDKY